MNESPPRSQTSYLHQETSFTIFSLKFITRRYSSATMYTFLVLTLFFLPLLHAERYQTPPEDQGDLFLPRSTALYYLLGQPMPRYPYPALDQSVDQLALSGEPTAQRQRTKRIYWENLAFHAANFNQKAKKL